MAVAILLLASYQALSTIYISRKVSRMVTFDAFNSTLAGLTTSVDKVVSDIASLKAQLASSSDPQIQAQLDAATTQLAALKAKLDT